MNFIVNKYKYYFSGVVMSGKRIRSANYTSEEKLILLRIINDKYKQIIENKKSDAVSSKMKEDAWRKIANEFNAEAPNVHRSVESLIKYYKNLGKLTRAQVANLKLQQNKTGGGPNETIENDPSFELTLSLLNKKSVYGLDTYIDSDTPILLENDKNTEENVNDFSNIWSHSHVIPIQLSTPKSKELLFVNEEEIENQRNDNMTTISSEPQIAAKTNETQSTATTNDTQTPAPTSNWTQRRRPHLKKTSSNADITKYYTKLAQVKLDMANKQEELLERNEKNLDLQKQSLELDIKLKKQKLQFTRKEFLIQRQCLLYDLKLKKERYLKFEKKNK